jgi:hypothetical protein
MPCHAMHAMSLSCNAWHIACATAWPGMARPDQGEAREAGGLARSPNGSSPPCARWKGSISAVLLSRCSASRRRELHSSTLCRAQAGQGQPRRHREAGWKLAPPPAPVWVRTPEGSRVVPGRAAARQALQHPPPLPRATHLQRKVGHDVRAQLQDRLAVCQQLHHAQQALLPVCGHRLQDGLRAACRAGMGRHPRVGGLAAGGRWGGGAQGPTRGVVKGGGGAASPAGVGARASRQRGVRAGTRCRSRWGAPAPDSLPVVALKGMPTSRKARLR